MRTDYTKEARAMTHNTLPVVRETIDLHDLAMRSSKIQGEADYDAAIATIVGRRAVFTTYDGDELLGVIEAPLTGPGGSGGYPVIRFLDGKWGRCDNTIVLVARDEPKQAEVEQANTLADAFLQQNTIAATTIDRAAVEQYARHHCGGLIVLYADLGHQRGLKLHDSWGDDDAVVVHEYDLDDVNDDDTVDEYATGAEALQRFLSLVQQSEV